MLGTGELGYHRLNGTRKIGPSYPSSSVYQNFINTLYEMMSKIRHFELPSKESGKMFPILLKL